MNKLRYVSVLWCPTHIVLCFLFLFVLCTIYGQCLWIGHLWLPLRYSLTFIYGWWTHFIFILICIIHKLCYTYLYHEYIYCLYKGVRISICFKHLLDLQVICKKPSKGNSTDICICLFVCKFIQILNTWCCNINTIYVHC